MENKKDRFVIDYPLKLFKSQCGNCIYEVNGKCNVHKTRKDYLINKIVCKERQDK